MTRYAVLPPALRPIRPSLGAKPNLLSIPRCILCIASVVLASSGCRKTVRTAPGSFTNSVGMEMVSVSPGYYVSKYETRQAEFEAVMACNPSIHLGTDHPVENITGDVSQEFCLKLTRMEQAKGRLPAGYVYDLPTYAQWMEYTADASLSGSITPASGRQFDTHEPVGKGEVNRLGLYDLRGNVAEFSKDLYSTGSHLILGAWWNEHQTDFLQVGNKSGFLNKTDKSANVGFRCVLVRKE